ncbi:hypothetical protein HDU76_014054 [Blyttiomyces sp. JEL0837]|nr:hypothetical protein HDU76_014054 [Blyttiomyces sp. JEL0837]
MTIKYLGDPNDTNYASLDITLPTTSEMYALHFVALFFIALSIMGSIYIIVRTIMEGKYGTIGERFPLYLAGLDLLWSLSHTIDHVWMIAAQGANPPDAACSALGAILALFLMAEIMLVNLLALSMFFTVYMNWGLSYGKYDYMLIILTFGVPITFAVLGLSLNAFGHDYYWCFLNTNHKMGQIFWIIVLAASIGCISIPAICFYLIYRKVAKHTSVMMGLSGSSSDKKSSNNAGKDASATSSGAAASHSRTASASTEKQLQNKIVFKLLEYQIVLVLTFTCMIVYGASITIFKKEPLGLVFWVVICINSNGFFNFLVFLRHQLLQRKEVGTSTQQTIPLQNASKFESTSSIYSNTNMAKSHSAAPSSTGGMASHTMSDVGGTRSTIE